MRSERGPGVDMRARRWPVAALLLVVPLALIWPVSSAEAATFVVNLTGDADDPNLADNRCDIDNNPATPDICTLRAAIRQANALGGSSTITLPAEVYTLTRRGSDDTAVNGDLDIIADITIN